MDAFVRMEHISKSFSGVKVLDDISIDIRSGEVLALMGENGAGKSTLIKILNGVYQKDAGEVFVDGEARKIKTVEDAQALGIYGINQEICLANNMSVAENFFMGKELAGKTKVFVDFAAMRSKTQRVLDEMRLPISAGQLVGTLSIAQQQMVEISRALFSEARLIVLDEPTASLTDSEITSLFCEIEKLKAKGISFIYISHRLEEIERICDRITVLRDGKFVGTIDKAQFSRDRLIQMMVGRNLEDFFHKTDTARTIGSEKLAVKHLSNKKLKDVSFTLRQGEILGFAGLLGAGRTELAQAILGIDKITSGTIELDGREITVKNPRAANRYGIALVPEDRKKHGLVLCNSVGFNLTIAVLDRFLGLFRLNRGREAAIVKEYRNTLSIKMASVDQLVRELSGGNQQKVVVSKWLASNPQILILDEPTRGIDVAAKSEIYQLMNEIVRRGVSIMLISSEMAEILNLCDRIIVMHEGQIAGEIDAAEATQEKIMLYASGGKDDE